MLSRSMRLACLVAGLLGAGALWFSSTAGAASSVALPHKPLAFPTLTKALAASNRARSAAPAGALVPPAVDICQAEQPLLQSSLVQNPCIPLLAAGQPLLGNMSYFGGHVQVSPKIYVVFWGWGLPGAFPPAAQDSFRVPGAPARDPDGVANRMTQFISALGGTDWAGSQTQYYETVNGHNLYIQNPRKQLYGVWWDNGVNCASRPNGSWCAHPNESYWDLAEEASRAVQHFHIGDLNNSQIIVAQPPNYEDGKFLSSGYCAWHDYTIPQYYPGITPGISFTNLPYVLQQGLSCGEQSVNSGAAGNLDGVSIVLGHEIEETVTDPGAEDYSEDPWVYQFNEPGLVSSEAGVPAHELGGWFDYSGAENGDKCAWVGNTGLAPASTVPGGLNNIRGNDGRLYPVQALWSNSSLAGAGWCAGAGDDLPAPIN